MNVLPVAIAHDLLYPELFSLVLQIEWTAIHYLAGSFVTLSMIPVVRKMLLRVVLNTVSGNSQILLSSNL